MQQLIRDTGEKLLDEGEKVEVPTWQALDVRDMPQGSTHELTDVTLHFTLPADSISELQRRVEPNLPWAENQFRERVEGVPLNPGETYKEWPWAHRLNEHKEQGEFSHTYMERYWPKQAGNILKGFPPGPKREGALQNVGLRYAYGDLEDLIRLLHREPTTRQAYLPVFFPEDTGAVSGERVPCTLGYLFSMRKGKLNITYHIRSCDFLRHFRDDVYMTARLCQWVCNEAFPPSESIDRGEGLILPGRLTMHIGSLHVFEGDLPNLRRKYGNQ